MSLQQKGVEAAAPVPILSGRRHGASRSLEVWQDRCACGQRFGGTRQLLAAADPRATRKDGSLMVTQALLPVPESDG
jgi:hypothetical protein